MTRDKFLRTLEEVLQIDAGTLKPGLALAAVPEWDSLGVVDFQGLADESLGAQLSPERINACNTVDDLIALLADKFAD